MELKAKQAIGLTIFLTFLLAGTIIASVVSSGTSAGSVSGTVPAADDDETSSLAATYRVKLEIRTDKYPQDVSWTLKRLSDNTVVRMVSQGDYGGKPNTLFTYLLDLEKGDYQWRIKDSVGDGLSHQSQGMPFIQYTYRGNWVFREDRPIYGNGINKPPFVRKLKVGYVPGITARQKLFLDAHNSRRKKYHAKYNKPYRRLAYSKELEQSAQRYAEELTRSIHNCEGKHPQKGSTFSTNFGENIATSSMGTHVQNGQNVEGVLTRFVEREENWAYPGNSHFLQVLWRPTRYMGVGEATANGCTVVVVRYTSAGVCPGQGLTLKDDHKKLMLRDTDRCPPKDCPNIGCY